MKQPAMILFDLDGTVLNGDKRVSARTQQALRKAAEQGVALVPATGRFFKSLPQDVLDLPFRYAITVNGATIFDRETQIVLHSETIDSPTALAMFNQLDTMDGIYDCYYDGWGYMAQAMHTQASTYAQTKHVSHMITNFRTPVPDLKAFVADKSVEKIQIFMKDLEEQKRQLVALPKLFPDLKITTSVPGNIEINSREAHKGNALVKLCALLDVDVADTVAFGDDLNDLSMLQLAGLGVAMGNGATQAKEVANRIALTNDEDGLALIVEELLG